MCPWFWDCDHFYNGRIIKTESKDGDKPGVNQQHITYF